MRCRDFGLERGIEPRAGHGSDFHMNCVVKGLQRKTRSG